MVAQPRINPIVLRHLVAELTKQGVHTAGLFRGMGFTARVLNNDPFFVVSHRQASDVIHRALRLTRDGSLGYSVGRRRTVVSTGFAGLGFLTCSSPREASNFVATHTWAFGTLLSIDSTSTEDQELILTATPLFLEPDIEPFLVEEIFSSLTCMFKQLMGDGFMPRQIDFSYARPAHAEKMVEFFGCTLKFGQPQNRLILHAALADTLPCSADPVVHRSIVERLHDLSKTFPASDICSTVEQALRARADNPPTLPQLAAMLNTSERTLRRRLQEQSTSYQQLLDDIRKEQALTMLRGSKAPITAVTQILGFSDSRNFRRAIQRWTGQAPTAIRKKPKDSVE